MRKLGILLGLVVVALGGVGLALAAGETTGTNTACATATTPDHVIADNGTNIATIPGDTATQCHTETYTIPTDTQTVTVTTPTDTTPTTTTTTTTPPPPPTGCDMTESSVAAVNTDIASAPAGSVICLASGSYGALTLTNNGASASNPTIVEAQPGGSTTVNGASLGTSGRPSPDNLIVRNFHISGEFDVGSSAINDTITHNDIYTLSKAKGGPGCGGLIGIYPQNNGADKNLYITHNRLHDDNPDFLDFATNGCQADTVDLYGQYSNILFAYNELDHNRSNCDGNCAGSGNTHSDTFQICAHCGNGPDAPAGVAPDIACPNGQTVNMCIYGNYLHDNSAQQGLPFWVGHDNGTFASSAVIDDNLIVRYDDQLQSGLQMLVSGGSFEIKNNTLWSTTASMISNITPNDSTYPNGAGSLNLGRNVFDKIEQWNGSHGAPYTFPTQTDYYNDYRSAAQGFTPHTAAYDGTNGGDAQVSSPGFKCDPTCGDGTAAGDDYELATNPNNIGIDWAPSSQSYGPQ